MKPIRLLVLFLGLTIFSNATAQEIHWVSLEEAINKQKETPKKIMIDAYTNWCGPCRLLEKRTYGNPDVINYINAHYYSVKFNAEGNETITFNGETFTNPNYNPAKTNTRNSSHQLARYLKIRAFPTILFLDEQGSVILPLEGFRSPTELELYLKLFKDDAYKSIKSNEDFLTYYNAFKPEFKE